MGSSRPILPALLPALELAALHVLAALAMLAALVMPATPARAVPVLDHGVGAFVFVDAGSAHWFVNAGGAGVSDTGLITQGVSDTARGGAQIASTSAYASLGALGGAVLASTNGALLETAQGSNDLSWYADLLVTGVPGTKVAFTFGAGFEAAVNPGGERTGGRVQATTFVGGIALADWVLLASSFDGPAVVSQLAMATYAFDVGSVVRLAGRLGVSAHADIEGSVQADALHTSRFYVDVLTPGGGYVAGGGVVFATLPVAAVPEPPAALLLALGLALLRGCARRLLQRRAARAGLA